MYTYLHLYLTMFLLTFTDTVKAHPTAFTLGTYYVLSNAISAMPTPGPGSKGWYRWIFDFSHLLAGNVARIVATRYGAAAAGSQAAGQSPRP